MSTYYEALSEVEEKSFNVIYADNKAVQRLEKTTIELLENENDKNQKKVIEGDLVVQKIQEAYLNQNKELNDWAEEVRRAYQE